MIDKKILIFGSILAVSILIGVSFTSVVGYGNNTSNSLKASPLYNIRTNKAIDNGVDVTTCDYVGKGRGLSIPISDYDNIRALHQLLDRLKRMNEIEHKALRKLVIKLLNNKRYIQEVKRDNYINYPLEFTFEDDPETCSNFLCFIEAILVRIVLLGMALFVSIGAIILWLFIILTMGIGTLIAILSFIITGGKTLNCWTGKPTYCVVERDTECCRI
jgi:hypothetical protein